MILDKIKNIDRYQTPQKGFETLKKIIGTFNKNTFQKGRFEIDGDTLFGIGLEYETKDENECLWEAHRKYIDIHIILEGEETIFVNDIENMETTKEYDEKGDYALFDGASSHICFLEKGSFLVLYPNEVHKTSIKVNEASKVLKYVVKLAIR